jgi:hypothetical protein
MKFKFLTVVFYTTALFGAITCLTGCATTDIDGVKTEVGQCGLNTECTSSGDLQATTRTGTGL